MCSYPKSLHNSMELLISCINFIGVDCFLFGCDEPWSDYESEFGEFKAPVLCLSDYGHLLPHSLSNDAHTQMHIYLLKY